MGDIIVGREPVKADQFIQLFNRQALCQIKVGEEGVFTRSNTHGKVEGVAFNKVQRCVLKAHAVDIIAIAHAAHHGKRGGRLISYIDRDDIILTNNKYIGLQVGPVGQQQGATINQGDGALTTSGFTLFCRQVGAKVQCGTVHHIP